jgi:hypothetical protein
LGHRAKQFTARDGGAQALGGERDAGAREMVLRRSEIASSLVLWRDKCFDESIALRRCRLERLVDALQWIDVGNERMGIEQTGFHQPKTSPHPTEDRLLCAKVGINDLECHPVPAAKGDFAVPALVVTHDADLPTHPRRAGRELESRTHPGDLQPDVGTSPSGHLGDAAGEILSRRVDGERCAKSLRPLKGLRTHVRYRHRTGAAKLKRELEEIPHEPGAEDDDVVSEGRRC